MILTEDKIAEIKAASDIVDVVGDYVHLKRAGQNFKGLCPFHNEKTPSFNVNPSLGIFKCFGCGEAGDVISFLTKKEGLSFIEAVRTLAGRAGIDIPEEQGPSDPNVSIRESAYQALHFAGRFYHNALVQSEEGRERGLSYFLDRGLEQATIRKFGLGYSYKSPNALQKAAKKAEINNQHLREAGLVAVSEENGDIYERFRGRVMFPIFSHIGKVVGFGARVLPDDTHPAKYINSPESTVYSKSRVLYGLYQARNAIRSREEVLLVEGYMDVISLFQHGIENVVAASGTSLSQEQVQMAARYARRFILLFDADSAGAAATERTIDVILGEGYPAYVVSLPSGSDPDSFVKQFGARSFEKYIRDKRQSFVEFKVARAREAGLLDTPEGQTRAIEQVLKTLARIPSYSEYHSMWEGYLLQAANQLKVHDLALRNQFPKLMRSAITNQEKRESSRPDRREMVEEEVRREIKMRPEENELIRLMLEHGNSMVEHILSHMALEEFTAGAVRQTVEYLLEQFQEGAIKRDRFTQGEYGDDVQRIAAGALVDSYTASPNWKRDYGIEVPRYNADPYEAAAGAMTQLKMDRIREAIGMEQQKYFTAEKAGEDVRPFLQKIQDLNTLRVDIESGAFLEE